MLSIYAQPPSPRLEEIKRGSVLALDTNLRHLVRNTGEGPDLGEGAKGSVLTIDTMLRRSAERHDLPNAPEETVSEVRTDPEFTLWKQMSLLTRNHRISRVSR